MTTPSMNSDTIGKAATCAGVGAAIVAYAEGMETTLTLPMMNNRTVPLWAAGGVAAGTASVLSDYTHDVLMPAWHISDKFSTSTGAVLAMGTGAAGSMAVFAAADPRILRELGYSQVAMYGILSESLGSYAYNQFVKPMMA